MAFQLLNRAYAIGTVDGAGDITANSAQTGFQGFGDITAGNYTYVVVTQGALWAYLEVQKVGSILRPTATIDSSSNGNPITFDSGLPVEVFSDIGKERIVYIDTDDVAQNADAIYNSLGPLTLVALKTTPLPASGKTLRYLQSITAGDGQGAFYVWDPDEATAGDDFNYVVSSLSATGRWVRLVQQVEIKALAGNGDAINSSLYRVGTALRHKRSTGTVKQVPTVENFKQASYATLTELKAVASASWADGDKVELRGIAADGDIPAPMTLTWVAASTNTADLDVLFIRPDDISGSNPGRFSIPAPVRAIKFTNSDATPSVKGGVVFTVADTPPAAITAFDEMRDGQAITIQPGAGAQVFQHSVNFRMPGNVDFTLATDAAAVQFYKENGVVRMLGGAGSGSGTTAAADVTFTPTGNTAASDVQAAIVELQGDIDTLSAGGVANDSVTNSKLANMAQATIKGRQTGGGAGDPEDLTAAQATAILDTFTTSLKGLVPPPSSVTGKVLKDDGTWATVAGVGGAVAAASVSITDSGGLYDATDVEAALQEVWQELPTAVKTASFTLALADAGKTLILNTATPAQAVTIPAHASVAFPVGTVITLHVRRGSANWSVNISGGDILTNSGDGITGSRQVNASGLATLIKVSDTGGGATPEWIIAGNFIS